MVKFQIPNPKNKNRNNLIQVFENEPDALRYASFGHFNQVVTVFLVGFAQVRVNEFGLFVIFVTLVVADVNFFPGRQNEDFGVNVFLAGSVEKSGITVADVMHVSQNVRNAAVDEHQVVRFGQRVVELFFASFKQQFAEQKRLFEKQLFDALFFGFHRDLARNLGIAAIALGQQSVDDGGFSGSGAADNDNNFFLHVLKIRRKLNEK